jgi:hypothetical protein
MRYCKKCGSELPFTAIVDGKRRNLGSRCFCLVCSPWKSHNTIDLTKPLKPKTCWKCGRHTPEVAFYHGQSACKSCTNRSKADRDIALKKKAIEYKGGRCHRCGYAGHYAAFDFHHLQDKAMSWNMMRNTGWDGVCKELDKCELVCANCHRVIHARQLHQ